MKTARILCLTLALAVYGSNGLMAQSTQQAVEHMNQVYAPFSSLKTEIWQYLKSITQGKSARKVEKNRKKLLEQLALVSKNLKKIAPFEGDASLKDAALEYLQLSTTVLKEDYDKIVDMEEIAEQSYDLMEAYITAREKANEKLDEASDKLDAAQHTFGTAHNITINEAEEDELSKKIKNASDALKYYNKIYLIFFKCYKQEAYVLDAQQKRDVSGFQQSVNALKSYVEEGLAALEEIEPHKGDAAAKVAGRTVLNFYKAEAEKDFPKVSEFFLTEDAFNQLNNTMQGMRESDRTQKDVDAFNKAVNEFNAAVNKFNTENQEMNKKRGAALDKWNETVAQFLESHSK